MKNYKKYAFFEAPSLKGFYGSVNDEKAMAAICHAQNDDGYFDKAINVIEIDAYYDRGEELHKMRKLINKLKEQRNEWVESSTFLSPHQIPEVLSKLDRELEECLK